MRFNLLLLSIITVFCFAACQPIGDSASADAPVIDGITAARNTILVNDTTNITVSARDLNDEQLDYVWTISTSNGGSFEDAINGSTVTYRAPFLPGDYVIKSKVINESNKSTSKNITIKVTNIGTPIVEITQPTDAAFISASAGIYSIKAKVTNVAASSVDSMVCYIDNKRLSRKTLTNNTTFDWDVTALNGSKRITVQAWARISGPATTDSSVVNVSIEGTISKPGR